MTHYSSLSKGIMIVYWFVSTVTLASAEPAQANNSFVVDLPYPSHFLYSLQLFNLSFPFFVNVSDPVKIQSGSLKPAVKPPARPLRRSGAAEKFKREQGAQKFISNGRLPDPDSSDSGTPSRFGSRDPSWRNSRYEYFTRRTTTRPSETLLTTTRPALQTSPFRLRSSNRLAVKRGYKPHNETRTGVQLFQVIPKVNAAHLKQQTQTFEPLEAVPRYALKNYPTTATLHIATTTPFPPVLPTSKAYIEGVVVRPEEVSFSTERVPRSQNVFFAANQLERAAKDDRVTTYNPPFSKFTFSLNYAAENSTETPVTFKDPSSFPEKISSALAEVTKLLSISALETPATKFADSYSTLTTAKPTPDESHTSHVKTATPTQLPKPDVSLQPHDKEPQTSINSNIQSFLIPAAYYTTTEVPKEYKVDILSTSEEVNTTSAESRTESVEDLIRKYISSSNAAATTSGSLAATTQQTPTLSTEADNHPSSTLRTLETTTSTTTTTTAPTIVQPLATTEAPLPTTSPVPPSQIIPSFPADKTEPGTSTNTTIISVTTTPLVPTNNASLFPLFPNFSATQVATPAANNPTSNPQLVPSTNNPNPLPGAQLSFPSFPAPQFNTGASPLGSANPHQTNFASSNLGATLGNITSLVSFNQHFPGISVFEALVGLQAGGSGVNPASGQGQQQINLQAGANGLGFSNSVQNPYLLSGFGSTGDGSNAPNLGNAAGIAFGQQTTSPNFANQLSFQFPVQQQNLGGGTTGNLVDFASLSQSFQQNPAAAASQSFAFGSAGNFPQGNINPVSNFPSQFGNLQQNLGFTFNPGQFGAGLSPATGVLNAQYANLPGQTFSLSNTGTATQATGTAAGDTTQATTAGSSSASQ